MDNSSDNRPVFEIGLVMAGAVSAGAYTAGVLDYLFEALNTWQKVKDSDNTDVPRHQIVLRVMSGASAGGIAAAIAAVELLERYGTTAGGGVKSLLYQAWVDDIDISYLLETNDLRKYSSIKSLFDATIIDRLADKIIQPDQPKPFVRVPFVDERLKLYLTLSNLRGLPYSFQLRGETGFPYGMTDHADYQYIEISSHTTTADWLKLRDAAVATAAYPVGLAARLIQRDTNEYAVRLSKDGRPISGLMDVDTTRNEPYNFVSVDGGMLNNEPIELARSVWNPPVKANDSKSYLRIQCEQLQGEPSPDHALVLIDPFPDQASIGEQATEEDTDLLKILWPMVGAMRSQSLFKLDELLRAGDKDAYDRFLIAPIRYTDRHKLAAHPIASGFLDGFGGFFSRDFREHDYQLGRRNGQRFIQKYFALPADVAKEKFGEAYRDAYAFEDPDDDNKRYYPLIPIMKNSATAGEQRTPPFPAYPSNALGKLEKQVHVRTAALYQRALPFGWVSGWQGSMTLIIIGLLIVAGELLRNQLLTNTLIDRWASFSGSIYVLLFEIILIACGLVIFVLRWAKYVIQRKTVKKFVDYVKSEMISWGVME